MGCGRCPKCLAEKREFEEATEAAMKHLDALGVEPDSIQRGYVKMHLACQANPLLGKMMLMMYPSNETLTS
jgi:hypothetical protein